MVRILFFSEDELSLEFMGVFKIKRDALTHKSQGERNYDSLSVRVDGSGYFETKEKSVTVKEGDVLYIPKNEQFFQKTRGEKIYTVHFINYSYNNKNVIEKITVDDYGFVVSIFEEMYNEWKEQKQGCRYKCISLLYSLLYYLNCQLHDNVIENVSSDGKLKKALDYIHAHYRNEQISIPKLAAMCAVSETYFREQFKTIYEIPPSKYILNLRMEYSSYLLKSGLYSVLEVSEKSGFNDVKYFRKLFKKYFQCSPKEYQNLLFK